MDMTSCNNDVFGSLHATQAQEKSHVVLQIFLMLIQRIGADRIITVDIQQINKSEFTAFEGNHATILTIGALHEARSVTKLFKKVLIKVVVVIDFLKAKNIGIAFPNAFANQMRSILPGNGVIVANLLTTVS